MSKPGIQLKVSLFNYPILIWLLLKVSKFWKQCFRDSGRNQKAISFFGWNENKKMLSKFTDLLSGKVKSLDWQGKQQKVDKKSCLYTHSKKNLEIFSKNRIILQTFLLSCYPTDRQHLTALTLFDIVFIPAPKPSRKIGS